MKNIVIFTLTICLFLVFSLKQTYAIYDPLSQKNNIFGIHILYTEEIGEAANLVNSSEGQWGYVTIPIQASDRDLEKWQKFMDECRKHHIIPIVRIATNGDYFNKASWSKPSLYDIIDFANFLDSLEWPTKNRYVIIYNEQNRGDEWGGIPNPSEYAQILDYSVEAFKQKNSDFFIIAGGFDNASINIPGQSINQFTYIQEMESALPGVFSKIDGISAHAYGNPAFSAPPSKSRTGIYSYYYQKQLTESFANKKLPVFITETGWTNNSISQSLQSSYYKQAFSDYWNGNDIVAVTPFILNSADGPFEQFSFIRNSEKTEIYKTYQSLSKVKGEPLLTKPEIKDDELNTNFPTKKFDLDNTIKSVFGTVNKSSLIFFQWLINN